MVSYTVKQTVVENLNADLDGKQPAGDYPTNASLTESLQSNLLNYTTNRILEIPQDIKLELNNGNVTLKAGSKVYVPNGFESDGTTPKFDVVTVQNDTSTNWKYNSKYVVYFDFVNNIVNLREPSAVYSGSTQPSGNQDIVWYDTGNNLIKTTHDYGSTWGNDASFPVAIATDTASNGFTSIDQVFNGFGYIGSTVFALPGIKCQFADGRNEDGSYKSYIKTTDKVLTKTFGAETFNGFDCSLTCGNDTIDDLVWHVNEDFDNKSGYIIINKTERIDKNLCPAFRFFINSSSDNGRISQFIPNPVDKLNWKSTELSGMCMPSNKYIDLTLGASGTTYAAPANGWFVFARAASANNQFNSIMNLSAGGLRCDSYATSSDKWATVFIPAKKGDTIRLEYTTSNNKLFRFIYADGEN